MGGRERERERGRERERWMKGERNKLIIMINKYVQIT